MTPDEAENLILSIGEAAFARHLNYWVRTVLTDGESIRHFRAGIAVEARRAADKAASMPDGVSQPKSIETP